MRRYPGLQARLTLIMISCRLEEVRDGREGNVRQSTQSSRTTLDGFFDRRYLIHYHVHNDLVSKNQKSWTRNRSSAREPWPQLQRPTLDARCPMRSESSFMICTLQRRAISCFGPLSYIISGRIVFHSLAEVIGYLLAQHRFDQCVSCLFLLLCWWPGFPLHPKFFWNFAISCFCPH